MKSVVCFSLFLLSFNYVFAQTEVVATSRDGKKHIIKLFSDDPDNMPKWYSTLVAPGMFISKDVALSGKYSFQYKLSDRLLLDTKFIIPYVKAADRGTDAVVTMREMAKMTLDLNGGVDYELFSGNRTRLKNKHIGGEGFTVYVAKLPRTSKFSFGVTGTVNYLRTPSVSLFYSQDYYLGEDVPQIQGDFYMMNQSQMTVFGGVYGAKVYSRTAGIEPDRIHENAKLKVYCLFGKALSSNFEVAEVQEGMPNGKEAQKITDQSILDKVTEVEKMSWRAGVDFTMFRPNAVLMTYFNVGAEFGMNPYFEANGSTTSKGFFSFHFGYTIGQNVEH